MEVDGEYAALLPEESEFEVRCSEREGRFMATSVDMAQQHHFLIEKPLIAWPLVGELCEGTSSWCELCFCGLEDVEEEESSSAGRRVRRRLREHGTDALNRCADCLTTTRDSQVFFSQEVLSDWRQWQKEKSAESCVGLEAFGRCLAQVAGCAARLVARDPGTESDSALQAALTPFARFVQPPDGSSVTLKGTDATEVVAKLQSTTSFMESLVTAVGSACVDQLLSADLINSLAGALVLNTIGLEVPQRGGESLRVAGLFVLLSTMNHSCVPTAEAVCTSSVETSLWTTRAVPSGKALTLTYVPPEWALQERRERLRHWFFECDCLKCAEESAIIQALGDGDSKDEAKVFRNTGVLSEARH